RVRSMSWSWSIGSPLRLSAVSSPDANFINLIVTIKIGAVTWIGGVGRRGDFAPRPSSARVGRDFGAVAALNAHSTPPRDTRWRALRPIRAQQPGSRAGAAPNKM